MASLLERMNITAPGAAGPVRNKSANSMRNTTPYSRPNSRNTPKGNVDGQWSHDLYDQHNSLAARITDAALPQKANLPPIAQRALRDAVQQPQGPGLSIRGAAAPPKQANVVDVSGLVAGTTPDDVKAIFSRCGDIASARIASSRGEELRIRVVFKEAGAAKSAVGKFDGQQADGKTLSVKLAGESLQGTKLISRLGGKDGLGIVRDEGSVDILMDSEDSSKSKLRSDSIVKSDPRASVMTAPPGADPADYAHRGGRGRRGGGRNKRGRGGKRGGGARMDVD
ncbi:uncharacterized protein SCHCODRAFT_02631467 [Schizophyllum commune H4-8]|uniref:RRM domain-containing protein n=1 Tax=Schizophyllum commune (strain H4-8 / FGSC 9210) TaxID=578458 RepID=D8Q9R7_SCHCM|nr:uncharacterized protein SCHCODRAFT_02631467 [Schizophyllum commune H4-8]KAI5890311.1 hypothetical protein SCHCODRAFT_02631467 [Schizophyllum commune H4-8]